VTPAPDDTGAMTLDLEEAVTRTARVVREPGDLEPAA